MLITSAQLRSVVSDIIQEACGSAESKCSACQAGGGCPGHDHHSTGRDMDYGSYEGHMTKSQLFQIAQDSTQLHGMLQDSDDLPEWVQSKIAVIADDLDSVFDYLEYELVSRTQ